MRSPLSALQSRAMAASVALGLELAAGCHHADGLDRTAPLLPVPLAWSLSEGDAFSRLERAGMAPHSDELHAYFTTPDQFHAAPGTIEVAHTVEPMILFTPRAGWTATVHYRTVGGPLDRGELTAHLPAAAARTELAALERRYGPPMTATHIPATHRPRRGPPGWSGCAAASGWLPSPTPVVSSRSPTAATTALRWRSLGSVRPATTAAALPQIRGRTPCLLAPLRHRERVHGPAGALVVGRPSRRRVAWQESTIPPQAMRYEVGGVQGIEQPGGSLGAAATSAALVLRASVLPRGLMVEPRCWQSSRRVRCGGKQPGGCVANSPRAIL